NWHGMYRYNGLFIQVMNDHIWRNLIVALAPDRIGNIVLIPNFTYGDMTWVIPLTTDSGGAGSGTYPNWNPGVTGFVEHYLEQANSYLFKPFTQRDCPSFTSYLGQ